MSDGRSCNITSSVNSLNTLERRDIRINYPEIVRSLSDERS